MKKIIKTIHNISYTFINESWSTSNSWGHRTILFKGDNCYPMGENNIRYYNRTWEVYQYQSCMQGCVNNIIDVLINEYIANYKSKNNITRFKKCQKDVLINTAKKEKDIYELLELLESLR